MSLDYFKQVNWMDVLVAILLIRIVYVAVKTGFTTELFKLLGTLLALYLSCHYYTRLGTIVDNKYFESGLPKELFEFLSFVLFAFLGYFIFAIIRRIFVLLIKMEPVSQLNRWGAFILGVIRGAIFISLMFYAINVSSFGYIRNSLAGSFSMRRFFCIAPRVYSMLWNGIMSRFSDTETANKRVIDYGNSFSK